VIDADTLSAMHDEPTGEAYAVIPDTDGGAHHTPPAGSIVEVRRFGGPDDPRPTLATAMRSPTVLRRVMRSPMKGAARTAMSTGWATSDRRVRQHSDPFMLAPFAEPRIEPEIVFRLARRTLPRYG
jgi:hypothetical protein